MKASSGSGVNTCRDSLRDQARSVRHGLSFDNHRILAQADSPAPPPLGGATL